LEVGSENPRVTFSQANFYIGNILEGETGDNTQNPFLMTVQYGGWDYEVVEIEARFTGQDFDFTQILQIQVGRGEVLIIDADQNNAQRTSSYYEEAMDNLGLSHETAKIAETGNLGNEITNYDAVIVFSGTAQNNILTNDDWNALQNYYESGGKIIISGQNIAEDLAATIPNVLSDFLNVDFVDDNSNDLTINGTPGNPNTQEMYLVMAGSGGAWNQNSLDVIEALPGAESCFIYNTNNLQRMAGVRIADGSGNMFFCAFGIEGINDATTSGNTKLEVLAMMFEQFGMTGVKDDNYSPLPDSPQILSLYPNPFNSTLRIIYQLPSPGNVEIEIFDVLGQEVSSQRIENSYAGINEWKWFAGETISSGIYFIKLEIGEKNIQKKVILLK
jgi:hypothetical protein